MESQTYSSKFLKSIKLSEPEKVWELYEIIGKKWAYLSTYTCPKSSVR